MSDHDNSNDSNNFNVTNTDVEDDSQAVTDKRVTVNSKKCECCTVSNNDLHIASIHAMWKEYSVKHRTVDKNEIYGMSEGAKGTTIVVNKSVICDAGIVPNEIGQHAHVVLVTHGHSDHAKGLYGTITDDSKPTIFCPYEICEDIWYSIKSQHQMTKGRPYSPDEMKACFTLVGIKNPSVPITEITLSDSNNTVIAKCISYGEKYFADIHGGKRIVVQGFKCTHSVPTVGYVVSNVTERLADEIVIPPNSKITNNFTEDQIKMKRNDKNKNTSNCTNDDTHDNTNDDTNDNTGKYKDLYEFCSRNNVEIIVSIEKEVQDSGFILHKRVLTFPNGMKLKARGINNQCILTNSDFNFLSKYKIRVNVDVVTPSYAFFGDTNAEVFKNKLVKQLISNVKTIIIECSFIEGPGDTVKSKKLHKDRLTKCHMFLGDILKQAREYHYINFLLMHFSSCYKRDVLVSTFKDVQKDYPNIHPLIRNY